MHEASEKMIDDIVWFIACIQARLTLLSWHEPGFVDHLKSKLSKDDKNIIISLAAEIDKGQK